MPAMTQLRRARLIAATALSSAPAAPAAGDAGLAIAAVEAFPVQEPVSRRSYTVIKITTKEGLAGYGECGVVRPDQLSAARTALLGAAATSYDVIGNRLAGIGGMAAAVNMALLDIAGKFARAPAYQVLGGPTRFKARAFAPLGGATDAELLASMKQAQAGGYRAFAVPLPPIMWRNQGQAYVLRVARTLETLRAAGGEDADFILDGAGVLTPGDAASLCQALEGFHLLWFDEPCGLLNLAAVKKLARENVTPLGFGRNVHGAAGFQDLLREDAADVIRPDVARWGISEIRKAAVIAEVNYVAVAPYHNGGPVGTAAALHAAASMPNFFIQQIPFPRDEADRRMRAELAGPAAEAVQDGFAVLPAGPGLGINVDENALARYRERAS